MIHALLQEIEGLGCSIEVIGDKLKLDHPTVLAESQKDLLRKHKAIILELFSQQKRAKEKGWFVFRFGEAYEKRVGKNSFVYIFLEPNGTYTAWRGTWRESIAPETERILVSDVKFDTAFDRANDYIEWVGKRQNKPFKKR
jgi:hypothetical protein